MRTVAFECLYAFIVLAHDRRRILHIEVTRRPTALWLASQITEVFGAGAGARFLVRDNDGAYGAAFRDRGSSVGPRRPAGQAALALAEWPR